MCAFGAQNYQFLKKTFFHQNNFIKLRSSDSVRVNQRNFTNINFWILNFFIFEAFFYVWLLRKSEASKSLASCPKSEKREIRLLSNKSEQNIYFLAPEWDQGLTKGLKSPLRSELFSQIINSKWDTWAKFKLFRDKPG